MSMTQLDELGRIAVFVTGRDVTVQDIDDILKKAQNQLRATPGTNDVNIFWLVPALDSSSLRVPKNTSHGTSAPVNTSFHSPWVNKSLQHLKLTLRTDLPRLGAFVRPTTFICADNRTASDGSLLWCRINGQVEETSLDYIRVTPRAAALRLSRNMKWEEIKASWEMTRARDGDVLDL